MPPRTLLLSLLLVSCGRVGFDTEDPKALGEPCIVNEECLDTCIASICSLPSDTGGTCDLGDSGDCSSGLVCQSRVCVGNTGESCTQNQDCAEACIALTCMPLSNLGGACDEAADCNAGLECREMACSEPLQLPTFGRFSAPSAYAYNNAFPIKTVALDMNGDTFVDLVTLTDRGLQALVGGGNGSFAPPAALSGNIFDESDLVTADFNEDRLADLAVSIANGRELALFAGVGDGSFNPLPNVDTEGNGTGFERKMEIADLNEDGHVDLLVSNAATSDLRVLLGNGDGSFEPPLVTSVGANALGIAVGDVNGDDDTDVLVASQSTDSVMILLGDGEGTLTAAGTTTVVGDGPREIVAGDFNSDGNLDFATTNEDAATVSIRLGNGDGTFQTTGTAPSGLSPRGLVTDDFNGDGNLDLAVSNRDSADVSILLGDGTGGFAAAGHILSGLDCRDLSAIDVNGDGHRDLVVANAGSEDTTVILSRGDGGFVAPPPVSVNGDPRGVDAGDVNNDGDLDVVAALDGGRAVGVLAGNGSGNFAAAVQFPTGTRASLVRLAELNGDGRLDVSAVVGGSSSAEWVSMLGDGLGTFSIAGRVPLPGSVDDFALGDVNGDGHLDTVLVTQQTEVTVLPGVGDGTFTTGTDAIASRVVEDVELGDANGDDVLDLLLGSPGSQRVLFMAGNGDGTFQAATEFFLGSGDLTALAAGDVTGDGRLDMVVSLSSALRVLEGNGAGTFTPRPDVSIGLTGGSLELLDLDGDSDLDVVAGSNFTIAINNGGTFLAEARYGVPAIFFAAGDWDGDGRPDLVLTQQDTDHISVVQQLP